MSIDVYHPSSGGGATERMQELLLDQPEEDPPPTAPQPSPSKHARLVSLDMVRGLTIAVMIFVDEVGGVYPHINHSPWNNVTFADFVMPWFLFMVGTSMAFSLRRYTKVDAAGKRVRKLQLEGTKKVVIRAIKLYLLGVVMQGGEWIDDGAGNPNKADYTYGWNLTTLRFCGILNRIAWAYLAAGLAELWIPTLSSCHCKSPHLQVFAEQVWKWVLGFTSLVLYLLLTFFTYVPDWVSLYGSNSTNVTISCNVTGWIVTPQCSAASFWDRTVLGQAHLGEWMSKRLPQCSVDSPGGGPLPADAPAWCTAYMYDPEGLLASVPTVLTTIIGVHFGRVLKAPGIGTPDTRDPNVPIKHSTLIVLHWVIFSLILVALGLAIHFGGFPMNKQLWSPSYLCFMAGTCGLGLVFFYIFADWREANWTKYTSLPFRPLQFMGMNAILVFFFHGTAEGLIEAVYVAPINDDDISNRHTLLTWFYDDCLREWFPDGDKQGVQLTFTLTKIAVWFLVCYALYRAGYFWKI